MQFIKCLRISKWALLIPFTLCVGCSCTPRDQNPTAQESPNKTSTSQEEAVPQPTKPPGTVDKTPAKENEEREAGNKGDASDRSSNDNPQNTKGGSDSKNGSVKGSGATTSVSGEPGRPGNAKMSPAAALQKAQSLWTGAKKYKEGGKDKQAFQAALEAWQITSAQIGDGRCRELTEEIFPILGEWGNSANIESGGPKAFEQRKSSIR